MRINFWKPVCGFVSVLASMTFLASVSRAEVRVGFEDIRGAAATMASWSALGEHLGKAIGEPVVVVPVTGDKQMGVAAAHQVDYMLANPAVAAVLTDTMKAELLASMIWKFGDQFGGVVFTTPKTNIKSIEDLRGKKLMAHVGTSAGGHLFPRYHVLQKGIQIPQDVARMQEVPRQDDIVLAVKSGAFDFGFVRTGIIEDMVKAGKVALADFVFLDKVDDPSFPFVRTTALYPGWYFLALDGADAGRSAKLKAALLSMVSDAPATKDGDITGFKEPLSIDGVLTVLKSLKAPPYDK